MLNFVTSLHEEGLRTYGLRMLNSVAKHWDKDSLQLTCYYHDFDINIYNIPEVPHIKYRYLNDIQDMIDFRNNFKQYDGVTEDGYDWRRDAIKWCHKVFGMTEFAFEMAENSVNPGWMIWLDADTVTTKNFSEASIKEYLNDKCSIVHMGRTEMDYSETSFLAFNLDRENPLQFLADLRGAYISGEMFGYREWHDGFIIERLLNIYKAHGTNTHNLTPNIKGLDAFGQSPISEYMEHFKGQTKLLDPEEISPDINGPTRYGQLLKIVQHYNIKSVIETGTWNGGRAIQMAEAAFTKFNKFTYTGFDLFEDATNETDRIEFNPKPHNYKDAVTKRLEIYQEKKKKEGKTFTFKLIKGRTDTTLPKKKYSADLAYIDGGISYPTVKNDYENIKSDIVVFNNYFSEDEEGNKPSEEHCGINQQVDYLIKEITDSKLNYRVKVLPSSDKVMDGGNTHLALVLKKDKLPDIPEEFRKVPIVVNPKDCMPDEYILNNVNTNIELVKDLNWIKVCGLTQDNLIVISGGDIDFKDLRSTIKKFKIAGQGYKIVCVKHAYPKLLKHKIYPDYCIILDPRPIDGISTHGVLRKNLFKKVRKDTLFLVASMTDPSVVEYLISKDADIRLWHAYSNAIRDNDSKELKTHPSLNLEENVTLVTGGTCAAMRTIAMFHVLGFRTFHLFGFDCSIKNVTPKQEKERLEDSENPKYMKVELHGSIFWTTGELLAMAQDCEKLFDRSDLDMNINFHTKEPTLASEVYKASLKNNELNYKEIFNVS
tara:strand:+ start:9707 stop:12010 length:2304 start_codon:yes stop_codon:yes gene_type:complete